MQRTRLLGVAASLCLLLGATACSGNEADESEDDIVNDLSQALQDGGVDAESADCQAAAIVDDLGVDALKDIDLSAEEPPEELQDELVAAAGRASDACADASG
jgi:hypothetical protein